MYPLFKYCLKISTDCILYLRLRISSCTKIGSQTMNYTTNSHQGKMYSLVWRVLQSIYSYKLLKHKWCLVLWYCRKQSKSINILWAEPLLCHATLTPIVRWSSTLPDIQTEGFVRIWKRFRAPSTNLYPPTTNNSISCHFMFYLVNIFFKYVHVSLLTLLLHCCFLY